jgi:rhamnose transport system permease protein
MDRLAALFRRWEAALIILILIAIVVGANLSPFFLSAENLLSQTRAFIVVGMLSLGLTIVVVIGEIDLSGESILAVCAVILGLLYEAGVSIWLGCFLALLLGGVLGLINGLIVSKLQLPSLVVTLASLIAYRGLAFVILERRPITGFPPDFVALGNGNLSSTQIPQSLPVFILVGLLVAALLHSTVQGRWMYAVGGNARTAELSGLPIGRIRILVFTLSGALAGLGAIILAARFDSVRADAAQGALLSAVTAVLLGGVSIFGGAGTVGGVVLSLILVGLLQNGMRLANIAAEVQQMIIGTLLIAAVIVPRLMAILGDRLAVSRGTTESQSQSAE